MAAPMETVDPIMLQVRLGSSRVHPTLALQPPWRRTRSSVLPGRVCRSQYVRGVVQCGCLGGVVAGRGRGSDAAGTASPPLASSTDRSLARSCGSSSAIALLQDVLGW